MIICSVILILFLKTFYLKIKSFHFNICAKHPDSRFITECFCLFYSFFNDNKHHHTSAFLTQLDFPAAVGSLLLPAGSLRLWGAGPPFAAGTGFSLRRLSCSVAQALGG